MAPAPDRLPGRGRLLQQSRRPDRRPVGRGATSHARKAGPSRAPRSGGTDAVYRPHGPLPAGGRHRGDVHRRRAAGLRTAVTGRRRYRRRPGTTRWASSRASRRSWTSAGLDGSAVSEIIHGTTVASNTILENKGARTALITTRGFRDVLQLRRLRVPQLYSVFYEPPTPLVERRLRLEVDERVDSGGAVITPLSGEDVEAALDRIEEDGAESVAVCFLHSYRKRRARAPRRRGRPREAPGHLCPRCRSTCCPRYGSMSARARRW